MYNERIKTSTLKFASMWIERTKLPAKIFIISDIITSWYGTL
jgi:hypothetical protein